MNILFQIDGSDQGGVLTWYENSSEALASRGYRLFYCCFTFGVSAKRMSDFGKVYILPFKPIIVSRKKLSLVRYYSIFDVLKNYVGTRKNSKFINSIVKKDDIDIVVANGYQSIPKIDIGIKRPKIFTFIHTTPSIDNSLLKIKFRYIGYLLNKVDNVFVVGSNIRDLLQPYSKKDIIYFPNCTNDIYKKDSSKENRTKFKIPRSSFCIGTLGRFTKDKGFKETLITFFVLAETNKNVHCVLAGEPLNDIDLQYYNQVFELAKNSEYFHRIHFLGFVEKSVFFSLVDLFYLFRINSVEAFGLVVIEAMSAMVPVIAPNVGGPVDIITHGVNGFLVNPGDISGYVKYSLELINNSSLVSNICENGKSSFNKDYSLFTWADRFVSFI